MGKPFGRKNYARAAASAYGLWGDRTSKSKCGVCGEPLDVYHNARACADRWVKQCDEEARRAKEARKP